MKAYESPIGKILTGESKFFVPTYQRSYRWDPEDVEQLIQDVDDSCKNPGEQEYFIGSIICIKDDKGRFEIVDGQQRLVTLTLIMSEMKKKMASGDAQVDLGKRILSVDPYSPNVAAIPTLTVRKPEHKFYLEYVLKGAAIDSARRMTDTQRVFLNNQKKIEGFLSGFRENHLNDLAAYLLRNVFVVFVEVNDRISSFRLFNVLNHRGMSLNDADLLKNALLEKVADNKSSSGMVEEEWSGIENIIGEKNLDDFLFLHQVSEKKDRNRVKKKNFDYYGSCLETVFQGDSVKMSKMLAKSAESYQLMLGGDLDHSATMKALSFLRGLSKPEEWVPAFMALHAKGVPLEEFSMFVELFEKVYMHSWLGGQSKSQRDSACYYAIEAINNGKSFDEIMDCVRARANNRLLEESLDKSDFYDASRPRIINLVKCILLRLDQERHEDNVRIIHSEKVTVEHILPQNMADQYWSDRFTKDDHEEWLHKLGNLTLISGRKNSAAKNSGFENKKAAYEKANRKSPFEITKEICGLPEWNKQALLDRHERLKAEVKKLWLVEGAA